MNTSQSRQDAALTAALTPVTAAQIAAHTALGDPEAQRRSDLLRTSLIGDSPAERRAAQAELDRLER